MLSFLHASLQNSLCISLPAQECHMHRLSRLPLFNHNNFTWRLFQIKSLLLFKFPQPLLTSSVLDPTSVFSLRSFLEYETPKLTSIKTRQAVTHFRIFQSSHFR